MLANSPLSVRAALTTLANALETEPGGTPASGASGALGAWPSRPPGASSVVASDAATAALQTELEGLAVGEFAQLRVALIRLDRDPPAVALWNPDHPTPIASTGKLAILYAAFQLREDVRAVARSANGLTTAAEIGQALRLAWNATGSARLALIANSSQVARLQEMFDFSSLLATPRNPDGIDFLGMRRCGFDDLHQDFAVDSETANLMRRLEDFPHGLNSASNWRNVAELSFAERLWMTIGWSDNVAASTCIWDIGLGYIQALLYDSGLFSDERSGLWLKRTFIETLPAGHNTRFGASPSAFSPAVAVLKKQNGTARALAALMAAISKDTLISVQASRQMKRLLRTMDYTTVQGTPFLRNDDEYIGIPSRIDAAIADSHQRADVLAKPGLFADPSPPFTTLSEWAILAMHVAGGTREIGLVVLGANSTKEDGDARSAEVEDLLARFAAAAAERLLA